MRKLIFAVPIALCAVAIGTMTAEAAQKTTAAKNATSLGTQGVQATYTEARHDAVTLASIVTSEADQSAKTNRNRSATSSAPAGTTRSVAVSTPIVGSHAALITAIPKAAPAPIITA